MLRIAQLTDLHLFGDKMASLNGVNTWQHWQKVLAIAVQWSPDMFFLTGDLVNIGEGHKGAYQHLVESLANVTVPCYWIPGNHDDVALCWQVLGEAPAPLNADKCIQQGNWQCILLDSADPGKHPGLLSEAQLEFLTTCLQQGENRHTLIALHHHLFDTDTLWLDKSKIRNAQTFLEIVGHYSNVRLVLSGHTHFVWHQQHQHCDYYISPAASYQIQAGKKQFVRDMQVTAGFRYLILHDNGQHETGVQYIKE